MDTKRCPRCGSPMIEVMEAEGHLQCGSCDLYLAAWAYPIVEQSYIDREDEATAQYPLPFNP